MPRYWRSNFVLPCRCCGEHFLATGRNRHSGCPLHSPWSGASTGITSRRSIRTCKALHWIGKHVLPPRWLQRLQKRISGECSSPQLSYFV